MATRIQRGTIRGERVWVVSRVDSSGKRSRRFFTTRAKAEAHAGIKTVPDTDPDLAYALSEASRLGLTLRQLTDAAKAHLDAGNRVVATLLPEAITMFLAASTAANRRPRYVASLRAYLSQFTRGRESMMVKDVDQALMRGWFAGRNEAPATKQSNIGRLSAFFGFCCRNGWLAANPCAGLDRIKLDRKPPQILTIEQIELALADTAVHQPKMLAWLTLALLAGLRPDEACRSSWDCLRGVEFVVDGAASKTRRRRIVQLSPNALAWLETARMRGAVLPASGQRKRRFIRRLRGVLGLDHWPQDILRHTAASYLLAYYGDAGKVAGMLGNSAPILERHYKAIASRGDGERFWDVNAGMVARGAPSQQKPHPE